MSFALLESWVYSQMGNRIMCYLWDLVNYGLPPWFLIFSWDQDTGPDLQGSQHHKILAPDNLQRFMEFKCPFSRNFS